MSSCSRITDDEMRYYQFKARQQYLIKKEDHEWNEFCKKNKCTCCSCLSLNVPMPQKDVTIQATSKSTKKFQQNTSVKRIQEKPLSKSLNDLEIELKKLKLTVSDMQLNHRKDEKTIIENPLADSKLLGNESALNLLGEQRQNLIRTSLLNSLQRLQSSATSKITKPLSTPSARNKSFFLPPNLERQRLISRNAYLSSLINKPKIDIKTKSRPLEKKEKLPTRNATKNSKKMPQKSPSKAKKSKAAPIPSLKEEKTLIQSETPTNKDENIETAIDFIVDDLLREEITALNRIRFMKFEKQSSTTTKAKKVVSEKKIVHLSQPSPETRAKIKKITFFNSLKNAPQSSADVDDKSKNTNCDVTKTLKNPCIQQTSSQTPSTNSKETQADIYATISPKPFRTIHTDPLLAQRVTRQRKLYFQYLKRIGFDRTHNFDPVALSNLVAESLLDDCISDVSKELDDVPNSLIADLYKQEFTSTL